MNTTRRAMLLAAAAMGASSASSARPAFREQRRILIDGELVRHPFPANALVIPAGVFLDPGLLAAAPPGDYEGWLTPANRFLLLEMLRHERIPHAVLDEVILFRKSIRRLS